LQQHELLASEIPLHFLSVALEPLCNVASVQIKATKNTRRTAEMYLRGSEQWIWLDHVLKKTIENQERIDCDKRQKITQAMENYGPGLRVTQMLQGHTRFTAADAKGEPKGSTRHVASPLTWTNKGSAT
jgi:hypothetical protein